MARKCILCGKEYNYCPTCTKDRNKPLWHKLYDSENCKNIFNALNDYNFNLISKEEAQAKLRSCDLSIDLNDHYRGEINAIMTEPEAAVEIVAEPEKVEIEAPKPKKIKYQPKEKEEI